ncbi:MAG: helix-turn-helix domain-containing protein [bacterium]|nr:helix-turn-helix domain-containing protein [bacterium]
MYEVHDWAEVHRLFHREGLSKSRIAERLGMSRNTVARLLSLDEPPRYRRKPIGSKLDPFKGSIAVRSGKGSEPGGCWFVEETDSDILVAAPSACEKTPLIP